MPQECLIKGAIKYIYPSCLCRVDGYFINPVLFFDYVRKVSNIHDVIFDIWLDTIVWSTGVVFI